MSTSRWHGGERLDDYLAVWSATGDRRFPVSCRCRRSLGATPHLTHPQMLQHRRSTHSKGTAL